jgi:putative copper export protein
MSSFVVVLALHVLGATVWTGGHLVLALAVLPRALARRSIEELQRFEGSFERVGVPALVVQLVTGLWLAARFVPPERWFDLERATSRTIVFKLTLLAVTAVLALDARLRLIPKLTPEQLPALAAHVIPVTVLSVLFVLAGVAFRVGGL